MSAVMNTVMNTVMKAVMIAAMEATKRRQRVHTYLIEQRDKVKTLMQRDQSVAKFGWLVGG